jgi:hypothetical protein
MYFLLRLILAPVIMAVLFLYFTLLFLYAGLGWIFTGYATITIKWPDDYS